MKKRNKVLSGLQLRQVVQMLIIGFVLLASWYFVSRFIRLIGGPSIVAYETTRIDEEYPAFLNIQGITKNTETLLINDYPVTPAVDGGFTHTFIAQPGYSSIILQAFDKFDNQTTETLALYTDEPPDSTTITSQPQPIEDTDVESEESLEINNS